MIVTWLRLAVFAGACVKHEMAKRPNGTPVKPVTHEQVFFDKCH